MTRAFLKNDMKGAFGHMDEKEEDLGHYSVDFREVIPPDDWSRKDNRHEVCDLKIDFHGSGAPKGGAQMFLKLDVFDVEELLPAIKAAYDKTKAWQKANPPMKQCEKCKGTGCKDGDEKTIPLVMCEACNGRGEVPA